MDEFYALVLDRKKNVLLTGAGGTGKSYVLKELVKRARELGITIEPTASTGVAAVNINGQTLHRFFGVGLAKGTTDAVINYVKKNPDAIKRIQETQLLVIDEISMVGCKLFEKLDQVAKHFRRSNEPFGGLRLVLAGDFLQLAPIDEEWVFKSKIWAALCLEPYFLTEPQRFDDRDFYLTLMRAREGELNASDIRKIRKRVVAYQEYLKQDLEIKPTMLYSHRFDVEETNRQELEKLPGPIIKYLAVDEFTPLTPRAKLSNYQTLLDYTSPRELAFKVSAQVMLTWNLNVEAGLCNGSRGIIKELDDDMITVKFRDGQIAQLSRINIPFEDEKAQVIRKQFPLILAFACTIHKGQGSTIDFCIMDLGPSIFAPGQAYVALSRARNWNSVLVSKFLPKAFKADPAALKFMQELEESC